jgi:hypothetical protein
MKHPSRIDLFNVKKALQTSTECLNALASVVEDDASRRKCQRDLEKTRSALVTVDTLLQNYQRSKPKYARVF